MYIDTKNVNSSDQHHVNVDNLTQRGDNSIRE